MTNKEKTKNNIRIITAASLFDGHDAAINIMRRILQDKGCEVIHLGHNRSVMDIVTAAIQESAQGICVSSYQGGHMEFFKYMRDLLNDFGAGYVKIYGGGGGTIIHEEKAELEAYGISRIYHPDDGRRLGLDGMIQDVVDGCNFNILEVAQNFKSKPKDKSKNNERIVGLALTGIEENNEIPDFIEINKKSQNPKVFGITGTGGAGKSSLVDELIQRFHLAYPHKKLGVFCVDPSKRKTGGSLLGDRIRMNCLSHTKAFMRSIASRGSGKEVAEALPRMLDFAKKLDYDLIIAETSGIGQADSEITKISDLSLYVMTSEFGAQSQLEKIDMIDFADLIAINKADRKGAQDALRDVQKQYKRSKKLFEATNEDLPVYLTQASHFNDGGVNQLFFHLTELLGEQFKLTSEDKATFRHSEKSQIIPAEKQNYLAEINKTITDYKIEVANKSDLASELGALKAVMSMSSSPNTDLQKEYDNRAKGFTQDELNQIENWQEQKKLYEADQLTYQVRGKDVKQPLIRHSLSGTRIKRIAYPNLKDWGERFNFLKLENVPGKFPFTAGVYPLKRVEEEPKRQFAGEGTPERTNKRFHYLSKDDEAKRLSVAFDSVTLYGEDPNQRPDIYGKVGESGVSICTLEDMKKLLHGFDLTKSNTSVSMTINGPAPIILAFYMNAAIDQVIAKQELELGRKLKSQERIEIKKATMSVVRGTVQADILKEDQAQNTCIFSAEFALKMMGDIQEYFTENKIKNFYSVSISGYHIAEAGANPISQLAFTLANGFTYVEYYLARGLNVDDFAPNLSFFFSNGLDPEYSVLGRVARRIWSIAMKNLYGANERSQKLKYHIQTSGRSLHAQEIQFNDIRTTLQALLAIYDNCNSLHTNAYDEAITTPTEESVRRAMAIQMIINREFGNSINENSMQGSYYFEELTDLVEEAVMAEFLRINERGGVLGAMETQYQRTKIQEESMHYEHLKHTGELPIIGVNTYIDPTTLTKDYVPAKIEMARATKKEKQQQLSNLHDYQKANTSAAEVELEKLRLVALSGGNVFSALMSASRVCSLGQMSHALYEVGGQYRRSL